MQTYRFNPPPGWPAPPPGWKPPSGWKPDPSLPPAPPGWQWWVPEASSPAPPQGVPVSAAPPSVQTMAPAGPAISPGRDDLRIADDVLGGFERECGTTNLRMNPAAARISEAGRSEKDAQRVLQQWLGGDDTQLLEPWNWLLVVARVAAASEELTLLARVCWFTFFWSEVSVPSMDRADFSEVLLPSAPAPIRQELAALGLTHLPRLDANGVVCVDAAGAALTAGIVLSVCKQGLARR